MSTRANIIISGNTMLLHLYHHCDGYPEGVGMDLKNYCELIGNNYSWDEWNIAQDLIKREPDHGYELTCGLHGDAEFTYYIDCIGRRLHMYRGNSADIDREIKF